MAYASKQRLTVAVLALAALAGCDEMGLAPGAKPGAVAATTGEAKPALRLGGNRNKDVEAPDVFSTTEEALWDGRPSLGGVWVASSDVVNPERVLMKNPKTYVVKEAERYIHFVSEDDNELQLRVGSLCMPP